jgi:thiamine-phosphate pyrophosphorylase
MNVSLAPRVPTSDGAASVLLPRLHLVTDTRRGRNPFPEIHAALAAGARVIQVRHKGGTDRDLLDLTRRVLELAEGLDVTVLVDDRLDIDAAAGAHGVHLGADDLPVEDAARLADGSLLIRATARMPGADATTTKKGLPDALGAGTIADVVAATSLPVIAIGGVTPEYVPELLAAGAHGVAVVSAISQAADPYAVPASFLRALQGAA